MIYITRILPILGAWLMAFLLSLPAQAQLEIDITKGNLDPVQIAIPNFLATTQSERDLGAQIANVIRADLERSGLFKALNPASFLETQDNIDYKPTFADWRIIKADALYQAEFGQKARAVFWWNSDYGMSSPESSSKA